MQNFILNLNADQLKEIYMDSLAHKISVGVDGIANEQFSKNLDEEVEIILRKISCGTYQFSRYKEKLILKGRHSNPRVISIPTCRDKLVLKVLHNFLKDNFDDGLINHSIHSKVKDIKSHLNSKIYDSYIKIDIKSFFPNINHDLLQKILHNKISDKTILMLIDKAIKQSTRSLNDQKRERDNNTHGVPQGLSISGELASIYLSHIDKKYSQKSICHYYRFVDDVLILCNKKDIEAIADGISRDMHEIGLEIHNFRKDSQKSSYGLLSEGVQFLGYRFKGSWISVRKSSIDKIYNGINKVFLQYYKYSEEKDLEYLYWRLNLKITGCIVDDKQYGWLFFFSHINDQKLLFKLDAHVKRACKRFKVPYNQTEIKKFSRTYYELLKIEKTTYIPKYKSDKKVFSRFSLKTDHQKNKFPITIAILNDIETDIEFY